MTTSYPYLTAARQLNADYGAVLHFAGFLEHGPTPMNETHSIKLTSGQRAVVFVVFAREMFRRRTVVTASLIAAKREENA